MGWDDPESQEQARVAIAKDATRLRRLAEAHDLSLLAYLLDMVIAEAELRTSETSKNPRS
jgi:hypothetical protein